MSTPNNGGPAFPSTNAVHVGEYMTGGHAGMTLREYFAGQALSGICANQHCAPVSPEHFGNMASDAIAAADALIAALAAREKGQP